jgi:glycolate oxidase iron-sulfur subunit
VLGPERVRELSQWLVARDDPPPAAEGRRLRIGLQDSCHLRNGMGVWKEPRALIERVGEYVELPSADRCCGAAGTYAVLRPEDSARVLDRHLDEIAEADLDAVVVVNPGCQRQLEQGIRRRRLCTRVLHLGELLADQARVRP